MQDWHFENPILFFGRLHPLLVHLPIGFLIALAALEVVSAFKRFRGMRAARGLIVLLTVLSAITAVVAGLLLETAGGYDESLIALHKWLGIGLAVACIALAVALLTRQRMLYGGFLLASLVLLGFASHFGGSMTHGTDYLTTYAPSRISRTIVTTGPDNTTLADATVQPITAEQTPIYDGVIQPMLTELCISCHSGEKRQGGLRVDSMEAILQGGEEGPAIVPGNSQQSRLIQRMHLPIEDKAHMPPKGKIQPTTEQLAVLSWWIDSGAQPQVTFAQAAPPAHISGWIASRLGIDPAQSGSKASTPPTIAAIEPADLDSLHPQIIKATSDLGVVIELVSLGQPWLSVNAAVVTSFGDAELAQLGPLAANIAVLNLAGTKVTDAGLAELARMPNLQRLRLERTAVTDAGLAHLANHQKLEYLNLWGTGISDAGLEPLTRLPSLRQLYLWRTNVTPDTANAFAEARVDKAKIKLWEEQIAALQRQIANEAIEVVHSMTPAAPESAPAADTAVAVNTVCPVSGSPIDATKFVAFEGRRVAFCCENCLAKFQQEPAAFASNLPPAEPGPDSSLAEAPATDPAPVADASGGAPVDQPEPQPVAINSQCPVSGNAVDAATFVDHDGRRIAFCCDNCRKKFTEDPAQFAGKLEPASPPAPEEALAQPDSPATESESRSPIANTHQD
jgi:YHS domain-containing protein/uncharacterized membrane protein